MTNKVPYYDELSSVELDFYIVCELWNDCKPQSEFDKYECMFNGKTIEYSADDAIMYITGRWEEIQVSIDEEMEFDDFNEYKQYFNNRIKPLLECPTI